MKVYQLLASFPSPNAARTGEHHDKIDPGNRDERSPPCIEIGRASFLINR